MLRALKPRDDKPLFTLVLDPQREAAERIGPIMAGAGRPPRWCRWHGGKLDRCQPMPPTGEAPSQRPMKPLYYNGRCRLGWSASPKLWRHLWTGGKRSRRTDSDLLQQMMRLKQQYPARGVPDSIAEEVVRSSGRRHVQPENQVAKLRDDFAEQQHKLSWFAKNAAVPFAPPSGNAQPSSVEERVIGRIMEIIPKELNVYDNLMDDAKKLGPDAVQLVKKCGRRKVNEFLEARITEQMSNKQPAPRRRMPRSFFDLIADDLERYGSRIVKGVKRGI